MFRIDIAQQKRARAQHRAFGTVCSRACQDRIVAAKGQQIAVQRVCRAMEFAFAEIELGRQERRLVRRPGQRLHHAVVGETLKL